MPCWSKCNNEVSAGCRLVCDVSQNTRRKCLRFEQRQQFSCMNKHFSACMHAWASVRECGLGLGSGSRQHMPDTALWGPAFIPSCFHSPTFGRCAEKMFSQVFTFQVKKVQAFAFAHTWKWSLSSWYLTCFSHAASTSPTTATFWLQDKQTNYGWSFIDHVSESSSCEMNIQSYQQTDCYLSFMFAL